MLHDLYYGEVKGRLIPRMESAGFLWPRTNSSVVHIGAHRRSNENTFAAQIEGDKFVRHG